MTGPSITIQKAAKLALCASDKNLLILFTRQIDTRSTIGILGSVPINERRVDDTGWSYNNRRTSPFNANSLTVTAPTTVTTQEIVDNFRGDGSRGGIVTGAGTKREIVNSVNNSLVVNLWNVAVIESVNFIDGRNINSYVYSLSIEMDYRLISCRCLNGQEISCKSAPNKICCIPYKLIEDSCRKLAV